MEYGGELEKPGGVGMIWGVMAGWDKKEDRDAGLKEPMLDPQLCGKHIMSISFTITLLVRLVHKYGSLRAAEHRATIKPGFSHRFM